MVVERFAVHASRNVHDLNSPHDTTTWTNTAAATADCWKPWQPSTEWSGGRRDKDSERETEIEGQEQGGEILK